MNRNVNGKMCQKAASILLVALLFFFTGSVCFGDAIVEEYWEMAFEVDYDVYVDAPDGGVNLRYGAGTEYAIALDHLIPNGTKLHISYETKAANGKTWGRTEYEGESGWVFLGQTSKSQPKQEKSKEQQSLPKSATVDYMVYVDAPDGGVNLRNGAGTEHEILLDGLIPNGTQLHITDEGNAANGKLWGKTVYNGISGWIFLGQTNREAPESNMTQNTTQSQEPELDPIPSDDQADESAAESRESNPNPPGYYTPMALVMVGLLILAVIFTAVFLIRKRNQ